MTTTPSRILLRIRPLHAVTAATLCLAIAGCAATPSPYGTPVPQSGIASKSQTCTSTEAPPDLAKQPNYRQVVVSAQTQNNRPLSRLAAKDLRLYQGSKELLIAFFQLQPAAVGILVDTSGSMESKLPICRSVLQGFVHDLNPSDEVFLLAFSDRVFILEQPTTDHARVIKSLTQLHAWGRTALYDSLIQAMRTVSNSCAKTRVIVLLTDGIDTASSASLKDTEEMSRNTNVPIYSIGIGDRNAALTVMGVNAYTATGMNSYNATGTVAGMGINPHTAGGISPPPTIVDDRVDTEPLGDLAHESGGHAYTADLSNNGKVLKQVASAIAAKIGNQYIVGFIGDGSTDQLRIEAPNAKSVTLKVIATD